MRAILFGHWGDKLLGWHLHHQQYGDSPVLLEHPWNEAELAFWRAQPSVTEVRTLPLDGHDYRMTLLAQTYSPETRGWAVILYHSHLAEIADIDPYDMVLAASGFGLDSSVQFPTALSLPPEIIEEAHELIGPFSSPLVHLHPLSTASSQDADHWHQWPAYLDWLFGTPITVVVTGLHDLDRPLPQNSRIINLIGRTPSNAHAFAMSEIADLTISTSNSIAAWSCLRQLPILIANNRTASNPNDHFRRLYCAHTGCGFWDVDCDVSVAINQTRLRLNV